MVAIACSYHLEIALVTFIPFQLGLAVVGVVIAYLAIRILESKDEI
ncbi:hypothetical protein ACMGD3_10305 [Lysinibacillus sphaericus]